MELDKHLTIKQVAEKIHVDKRTIHRWIQKGKLRAIRIPGRRGGEWRISLESLQELGLEITNNGVYTSDKVFIYCLKDPGTNEVRYIGQSVQPDIRHKQHLREYDQSISLGIWIKDLESNGLVPVMEIIEECSVENALDREVFWINHFRKTSPLMNTQYVRGNRIGDFILKSFCPYCYELVLPTPTGYLCKTHGPLTILQVISERVAELRRRKQDERDSNLP